MNSERYKDTELSPRERAQALLADLTLNEKMAQINCVFPFGERFDDMDAISKQTPFGIGQVSTLEMRRIETLEQAAAWQCAVQNTVMRNSPHGIPAIFHMEGLCGAFIQDAVSFPSGIARGAGWNPALEEKIARIVGRQEAACGITHIFAPVLDICRDPRMGRYGEAYGEDPTLTAAMGVAYARGAQAVSAGGRQPQCVAKHFLAFHNSQGGIHGTHSDTPARLLDEVYGKPFQAAIREAELKGIMPCYCAIDGEPASASRRILTALLREEMGFDGLCVSDYGAVGQVHSAWHVSETVGEAGYRCLAAGMDMELPSPTGFSDELRRLFEAGRCDMRVLDAAVLRVLTAKFKMGLFEHPFALKGDALKSVFYQREDAAVTLQSAKESMVLLKNDGALPISRSVKRLALIGPHADCARKFFGGYTHLCMMESIHAVANSIAGVAGSVYGDGLTIQTVPGTNIQSDETPEFDPILMRQKPGCKSLLETLREKMPNTDILYAYGYPIAGADQSRFAEALDAVRKADIVVLTLGGKHGTCSMASMGEGVDGANINLPACQDAFIPAAAAYGKPLIGVHFDGRPISSDIADQYLNAIIEAWNPSEAGGEAVASVLLGDCNPGGKLPVTVARHAGQIPVYYNHPSASAWHQSGSIGFANYVDLPHTPRYCFGHGLSYTRFAYSDLSITRNRQDDGAQIAFTLTNIGNCGGDETAQLYLRDVYASMTRPVKELAGFARVSLNAGEARKVAFTVRDSQAAFLDEAMRWKIEKGVIEVSVGSSSEDIRLTGEYRIPANRRIAGRDRAFYAQAVIA